MPGSGWRLVRAGVLAGPEQVCGSGLSLCVGWAEQVCWQVRVWYSVILDSYYDGSGTGCMDLDFNMVWLGTCFNIIMGLGIA